MIEKKTPCRFLNISFRALSLPVQCYFNPTKMQTIALSFKSDYLFSINLPTHDRFHFFCKLHCFSHLTITYEKCLSLLWNLDKLTWININTILKNIWSRVGSDTCRSLPTHRWTDRRTDGKEDVPKVDFEFSRIFSSLEILSRVIKIPTELRHWNTVETLKYNEILFFVF